MTTESREVRLCSRPDGMPSAENVSLETVTLGDPGPGEVQVRNMWMSVDPYMRGRMRDQPSYVPPFRLGEALQGGAVGIVMQSNYEGLAVGDTVLSMFGWREAFNVPGSLPETLLRKVDVTTIAPELYLSTAGLTGLTAWVGMLEVAQVQQGSNRQHRLTLGRLTLRTLNSGLFDYAQSAHSTRRCRKVRWLLSHLITKQPRTYLGRSTVSVGVGATNRSRTARCSSAHLQRDPLASSLPGAGTANVFSREHTVS